MADGQQLIRGVILAMPFQVVGTREHFATNRTGHGLFADTRTDLVKLTMSDEVGELAEDLSTRPTVVSLFCCLFVLFSTPSSILQFMHFYRD